MDSSKTQNKAYEAAIRHLTNRSRTCLEMTRFLQTKDYQKEDIDWVICQLIQLKYLDDIKYCLEYYRYSASKGKSLRRIKYELEEKGISEDQWQQGCFLIEDQMGIDLQEEEYNRACQVAEKVARSEHRQDKIPAKVGRRLSGLGYDSYLIYDIVGKYMKEVSYD